MGGVVKGIKKAFKAVAKFVKKYWIYIVIIAAVVLTCGLAAGAMAPAAAGASAAGTTAAAGGAAAYTGTAAAVAATSTSAGVAAAAAGTAAAVTLPTVTVTAAAVAGGTTAGMVAAGAGAAVGAAALAANSGGAAQSANEMQDVERPTNNFNDTSNVTDVGNVKEAELGKSMAVDNVASETAISGQGFTGMVGKGVNAAKGFWGGMSTGEKLMFASTAFSAISGAMKEPTAAEQGMWPGGAYFGMEADGKKTDLAGVYKDALTGKETSAASEAGAAEGGQAAPLVSQANPQQKMGAAMGQPATGQESSAQPATPEFMPAPGGAQGATAQTAQQSDALRQANQRNAEFFQQQRA